METNLTKNKLFFLELTDDFRKPINERYNGMW